MQETAAGQTAATEPPRTAPPAQYSGPTDPKPPCAGPRLSELEFYGCYARRMTPAEYDDYEGRVEFFDSRAGIAWMAREAAHFPHERPLHRLGPLLERIAQMRGSPIVSGGAAEIRWTLADGQTRRIQPDQMVYLDPAVLERTGPRYLTAGEDPYPDVVVEVDSTTDVRGNRLKLYEAWGFPEVWVEVPNAYAPGRRPGLRSGLRIHLLEAGRYVVADASRAFPGWRAQQIHRGLNESVISEETSQVLSRVGRALGEREGTGPDGDPLLREQREDGLAEGVGRMVRAVLRQRGVPVPADFPDARRRRALHSASGDRILAAASAASSFGDFLSRLDDPDD